MAPMRHIFVVAFSMALCAFASTAHADVPGRVSAFVSKTCADCHTGADGEGGFDVETLTGNLDDVAERERWVRMIDRVKDGEMPPADAGTLSKSKAESFTMAAGEWVSEFESEEQAAKGRVQARKLTGLQLERTLQDLLGVDIPLANLLPEEQRTGGFTTVAIGQSMSHFDLENHLRVVDTALEEAFRRAMTKPDEWSKQMSAQDLVRRRKGSRNREPEMHNGKATTWSHGLVFYGRISPTTARDDGWYRFSFDVSSLNTPEQGVWCTVRTGECRSTAPIMQEIGTFLATDKSQRVTFEAFLPAGHMFEVRPYDARIKKARTQGGQVGAGECQPQKVPGIAMDNAKLTRFHRGPDDTEIYKILFNNVRGKADKNGKNPRLMSQQPKKDLERLMLRFAQRAFRRPVTRDEISNYIDVAVERLDRGDTLITTLRDGYRSLLCSPRFLYLYEEPGKLDNYALASRLSYLLWNTMPDAALMRAANQNKLRSETALKAQVERMLKDDRGRQFVVDFAEQWLDLSEINFTDPDRRLYPDFDLIVQQSMLDETRAFLQEMLDEDLSVSHVVDSKFAFLNERLASHYGIDGVKGGKLRKVPLSYKDPRGGLMTQGAILKVTANGTTTSPVIRGVWVSERLLGREIPPPPENVPAVEPDIRGAKTIREQLEKHKSDPNCASCHTKIDPPGFALENFDPAGRWRSNYIKQEGRRKKKGATIDASFVTTEGKPFDDIVAYQKLLSSQKQQLARNVASQLVAYGTGAPVAFVDRPQIERVVRASSKSDYGFRTILHEVVRSNLFTHK